MNHDLIDDLTCTLNWIGSVNGDDDVIFDGKRFAVNNEAVVRACR